MRSRQNCPFILLFDTEAQPRSGGEEVIVLKHTLRKAYQDVMKNALGA